MYKMEHLYYEDQRGATLFQCDKGVDPVWYSAMMRKQRAREQLEQYRMNRDNQFAFKPLDEISNMLTDLGVVLTDTDTSIETPEKMQSTVGPAPQDESVKSQKRRLFVDSLENDQDTFPSEYCNVRDSERKVKDSFYLTILTLVG